MKYYEDDRPYSEDNNEKIILNGRNVIVYDELSPNQKKGVNRLFGCVALFCVMPFLLAGIAFLLVGLTQYHAEKNKEVQCTELIVGSITYQNVDEHDDFDEYGNRIGKTASCSGPRLVEYTYNGQKYRLKCEKEAKELDLGLHDKIEVYVDPSDPHNIYFADYIGVDKKGWQELALVGGIIICVFITAFAIIIISNFIKKKKSEMTDQYY